MLIVSDLDGTLLSKKSPLTELTQKSFEKVRRLGGICAIATGRSLFGVKEDLEPSFPIDYLIFSSGAGIYDWQEKKLLHQYNLSRNQIAHVYAYLKEFSSETPSLDFTIQLEAPDTHRFLFSPKNVGNRDFVARLKHHSTHGNPINPDDLPHSASEFIIIQTAERGFEVFKKIRTDLKSSFNVVRATSPIDSQSVWIEIFHPDVSKGNASDWIRQRHGISRTNTFALGNDYNDLQLLDWAHHPLVVGDAAAELLNKYEAVRTHTESALAHALEIWLKKINR